ncbi:MAG: AAA family ATPase [Rubrivivax sp.]
MSADLLERDAALATLQQLLREARVHGRIALVAGEAGIGKSSLLKALAATHQPLWWGRCDALDTPHPLAPLLDIARDARPHFAGRLHQPRPQLFDAVIDELRHATTPVLMVIEDAHWADEATLDLLKFLGRRIEGTHALLAISYRDDELTSAHPLRRLLGDLPPAVLTRLPLQRLSEAAVQGLAERAGRRADGLHARTLGNPFFVTEVLRDDGQAVPGTVQDLVLARYARLGGGAQAVLRVASLVPARIEAWLLQAVLAAAAADIEAALGSGLLCADADGLHYRHELARVAVESALLPPVAQALHRRLLDALVDSARTLPAARLAHHAERCGDAAAVRRFAPAAAAEAAARGSHREAAHHWQVAIGRTPPDDADEARLGWLDAYAHTCRQLARLDDGLAARRELDDAFRRRGDTRRRGLNLSWTAHLHVLMAQNGPAEACSREAIALLETLPPGPELAVAYGLEAALRMLDREHEASLAWCEKAVALARRTGHRERELTTLTTAATARLFLDPAAGVAEAEALLRLTQAEGQHAIAATLLMNLGSALGEQMRLHDALAWLQRAVAFATDHEMDGNLQYASAWLALCELRLGHWSAAAERAAQVVERTGDRSISRLMALVTLGGLRVMRGDPGAEATLDEALALAGSSATLQRMAPVRALRAEAAWLRGDLATCDAEARAALALAQQRGHAWFSGELAAWCWRAGTLQRAPVGCAEPYALTIAGRWADAAACWERLGHPYEQARALADGDADAQQQALQIFDRLGARPAADALRRRLRDAGVRGVARGPRASTRSHPSGLTQAEQRVLALMAADLRNADIAARLHRSVRTIDHQVAAVLAKLAVDTRQAAVRRAREQGWLEADAAAGPAQDGQSRRTR